MLYKNEQHIASGLQLLFRPQQKKAGSALFTAILYIR